MTIEIQDGVVMLKRIGIMGSTVLQDMLNEVMVNIELGHGILVVPLAQLSCLARKARTLRAIGDWHHWVVRGYRY
jgi:Calcium binding